MNAARKVFLKPALLSSILFLALCIRVSHFLLMKWHDPIFNIPIVDSVEYVKDAHFYLEQNWMGRCAAYPHPPMYPLFIALLFKIFANSISVVKLFQILIDLANTFFVYLVAKKVFNETVGLIGAALYAMYIPIIFYCTEILPPVLAIFFLLASILSLLKFYQLQNMGITKKLWLSFSGMSFGLLMITLLNFAFSLPFILLWQYKYFKGALSRRLVYMLIFVVFSLTPVILVTARNCMFANDCAVVSRNGGTNFYIGNNQDIAKTVSLREGIGWVSLRMTPFQTAQIQNFAKLDHFFYRKSLEFIMHQPAKWLWLMLKKTALFFNAYELPRNFDFYFFSSYSAVIRLPFVRLNLIFPLGITAVLYLFFIARKSKDRALFNIILLTAFSYSLSIIIFFISGRYRIPVIPLFIILAAYCIVALIDNCLKKNYRVVIALLAGVSFFAVLTQIEFFSDTYPYKLDQSHTYTQIAKAFFMAGKPDQAHTFIKKGLKGNPDESTYGLYALLGRYYMIRGEKQKAIVSFKKSIELKPKNFFAYSEIASLLATEGEVEQAKDYFHKGINVAPYFPGTYLAMAKFYSSIGDNKNALLTLASYRTNCLSHHPLIEYNLGKLYMDSFPDLRKAIVHFENAAYYPQFLDNYEAECSDLYNRLGLCYWHTGEPQKAKKTWLQGLKFFPRNNSLRKNLAMLQK